MARLIRPDGTEEHVRPKRGNRWTLDELQELIGGFIEEMPGVRGLRMLFDEEGQLKGLPFNAVATDLVMEAALAEARRRGCGLRYHPRIVGNALVLDPGERMCGGLSDGLPRAVVRHTVRCVALMAARAVGDRRVSTSEQAASGLGLEAQQLALQQAADRIGLTLVQTFTDAGVSGGLALDQRPALLAALDLLRSGDTLLVAKRDRLGRDVLNVAMIERLVERKGARIVSPDAPDTNDPSSRLMRTVVDAFAEYERALIRARTKLAMAAAKARGRRVGHVPFGSRLDHDGRTLVPNLEERQLLDEIRHLRGQGWPLVSIADELNNRGLRNRQGRAWKRSFVGQLLDRHP